MLRLIKSLILLYSCSIRKLQHLKITQCSCWVYLNYDTNLRHSTLWASSGLSGCHRNLRYYSFSHLLHCHHTSIVPGKSLEPSLQNSCTSSKFLKPLRLPASTLWCYLHLSAKTSLASRAEYALLFPSGCAWWEMLVSKQNSWLSSLRSVLYPETNKNITVSLRKGMKI